ncbi:Transcriptional regulatory protein KdpE [BD1-7 clade bacterium]|uniref:Transcriptional regulatory protein KdpE n=1 Tax=BD1-7 clade bacterium TaxID=2029982 RepID=A0A5S9QI08_9GAMM|nr:Transcriptional regulatory protein KdpE [BD1-7 clade bacterium]
MPKTNSTILVVDDSPESLGMINTALNNEGYTVLVALNGDQALNIARKMPPDIVLLDAVMPVMDGFETCEQLKAFLPTTPIIFMTGLTDSENILKAFAAGSVDYVTKPIKPEELIARIRVHDNNARMLNNAQAALDMVNQYVLAVNGSGDILWSTPQTQQYLDQLDVQSSQAERVLTQHIKAWLANHARAEELVITAFSTPLTINFFKQTNDNAYLLRIIEKNTDSEVKRIEKSLSVTPREAEVLLWLAQGKTNREIAQILDMQPRTVNKHLEQIYPKLEVDNRTAAASIAIKSLLGVSLMA